MSRRHASIGFARRPGRIADSAANPDPFTLVPPSLRGAWWRADMGITLTSGAVSGWTDAWAGEVFTQVTVARRPTVEAVGLGGRPTVLFDGVDDSLVVDLATPCAAGARPYIITIFQLLANPGIVTTIAALVDTGQGVVARLLQQNTGTAFRTFRMETTGVSESVVGAAINTNPHRIESGYTAGGTAALVLDSTPTNSVISGTPSVSIGHVRIGAAGAGGDQFTNVRIAEHMVLRDEPSDALKVAIRQYATRYYAGAV